MTKGRIVCRCHKSRPDPVLVLVFLLTAVWVPVSSSLAATCTENINSDYSVDSDNSTKFDSDSNDWVGKQAGSTYRTAIRINISSIPTLATITGVTLYVNVTTNLAAHTARIGSIATNPESASAATVYSEVATGTEYVASSTLYQATGWRSVSLGASAVSNLQSALGSQTWFAVGLKHTGEGANTVGIGDSALGTNKPYLAVTYTTPNPASPTPADGATSIPLSQVLSWSSFAPMDVYLDKSNATNLVSSRQSGTSYDPGGLDANSTYKWKIVAWDNCGNAVTGPVWTFTTISSNAPYKPTQTKLFDNEKVITATPTFEFSATDPNGDALGYKIQWGTDYDFTTPAPTEKEGSAAGSGWAGSFASGGTVTYTVLAGDALTNGTTYWWRVAAKDPGDTNTYGPWSNKRSFTVDTSLSTSRWFQTTQKQFDLDTLQLAQTTATGGGDVRVGSPTNYALSSNGGVASASSFQGSNSASKANDGSGATSWASAGDPDTAPEWLKIQLSGTYWVKQIDFDSTGNNNNKPDSFTVDVSTDGTNWTTVDTVVSTSYGNYSKVLATPVEAKYVRLYITSNVGAGAAVALEEFKVFVNTGTVTSVPLYFNSVSGALNWNQVLWSADTTGGTFSVKVQRLVSGSWTDTGLSGSSSPLNISSLGTEAQIRLVGTLTYSTSTPILNDWTVSWNVGGGGGTAGDVVINEIMWMGSDGSNGEKVDDEWLELRNMTSSSIPLDNWVIENAGGSGVHLTIPVGKSIPANGFFIVANYDITDANSYLNHSLPAAQVWVTTTLLLDDSYTSYDYVLKNGGTTIDTARPALSGVNASSGSSDYSMERNAAPGDGTIAVNWHKATTRVNWDATTNAYGTPGNGNGGTPVWSVSPAGVSAFLGSPTVRTGPSGDTVYVGNQNKKLYAIDATEGGNGALRWSTPFTAGGNISSQQNIVSNIVYFGDENGNFYAIQDSGGSSSLYSSWTSNPRNLVPGTAIKGAALLWTVASATRVFIGDGSRLYALTQSDGTLYTTFGSPNGYVDLGGTISSTPSINSGGTDGYLYIGTEGGQVRKVDLSDGTVVATFGTNLTKVTASAMVRGSNLYIGGWDYKFYSIPTSTMGAANWTVTKANDFTAGAWYSGGKLYIGNKDGKLYCINDSDGAACTGGWTDYTTTGAINASPIVYNGVVYVGSQDKKLYALNASTGALLWSYDTGAPINTTPAIRPATGLVYVVNDGGKVMAFKLVSSIAP